MYALKNLRNALKSNRPEYVLSFETKCQYCKNFKQTRLIQINVDEGKLISRNCAFFMDKAAIYIKINIVMPNGIRTRCAAAASCEQNRHLECKLNVPMLCCILCCICYSFLFFLFCFNLLLFSSHRFEHYCVPLYMQLFFSFFMYFAFHFIFKTRISFFHFFFI